MNYIGSKHKLSNFISKTVSDLVGTDLNTMVFCDLFAGTGIVGRHFKPLVKEVISNDIEYYSYVLNRHYIGNNSVSADVNERIAELNALEGKNGFIYQHYCKGGEGERQYFSDENGAKIDAIRSRIEEWYTKGQLSPDDYYHLLAALLQAADKVANTASVYGAYLKHLKKTAQKKMLLKALPLFDNKADNVVYNKDSNALIKDIEGDILYLDPPYNARQYGANYHLLNTIAYYDEFSPQGKTGLRTYHKSNYCKKAQVLACFEELIAQARFKYIFLSYNNEGLMGVEKVREIMSRYGQYDLYVTEYKRFKADSDENRQHKAAKTEEYLHVLVKLDKYL